MATEPTERQTRFMIAFLRRHFSRRGDGRGYEDEVLALESQVQALRLALAERDGQIARVDAEAQRLRSRAQPEAGASARHPLEVVMRDAAGPIAQLLAQKHLLEARRKPVEARHVIAVAARLVRVLEEAGLTIEAKPGDTVRFDSNLHEPLSAEAGCVKGEPVVVRLPGISFHGRLLRKAGVDHPGREA